MLCYVMFCYVALSYSVTVYLRHIMIALFDFDKLLRQVMTSDELGDVVYPCMAQP